LKLFDSLSTTLTQKGLDALWMKTRVISDNLANKDTPDYKAKYVEFNEAFLKELNKKQGQRHLGAKNGKITLAEVKVDETLAELADGNSVNIEKESLELDRTQIQYYQMVQKITSDYTRLRSAIKEGR